MQYDLLNTLRKPGARVRCDVDAEPPDGLEWPATGRVRGEVVLTNTGSGVSARGDLRATLRMECCRCLGAAFVTVVIDVNEDCALTQIDDPQATSSDQLPLLNDCVLDLSELVRQLLVLHTPPRAVCSQQCRGLCPRCGASLNLSQCTCPEDDLDPRLAPLQRLLKAERTARSDPAAARGASSGA